MSADTEEAAWLPPRSLGPAEALQPHLDSKQSPKAGSSLLCWERPTGRRKADWPRSFLGGGSIDRPEIWTLGIGVEVCAISSQKVGRREGQEEGGSERKREMLSGRESEKYLFG